MFINVITKLALFLLNEKIFYFDLTIDLVIGQVELMNRKVTISFLEWFLRKEQISFFNC